MLRPLTFQNWLWQLMAGGTFALFGGTAQLIIAGLKENRTRVWHRRRALRALLFMAAGSGMLAYAGPRMLQELFR